MAYSREGFNGLERPSQLGSRPTRPTRVKSSVNTCLGGMFFLQGSALWHHVNPKGQQRFPQAHCTLCTLRAHQLEKPGNVFTTARERIGGESEYLQVGMEESKDGSFIIPKQTQGRKEGFYQMIPSLFPVHPKCLFLTLFPSPLCSLHYEPSPSLSLSLSPSCALRLLSLSLSLSFLGIF